MTVSVRADVYPALLTIDTRRVERVRVIVVAGTPDRLIVFGDGPDGPQVVYSQAIQNFTVPPRPQRLRELYTPAFTNYTAETLQGDPITFQKGSGCGCGSRLKSYNPFPSIASLAAE